MYAGLAADERRAERRERLLEAGLDLLGRGGWQAATVTAVCERARLTPRYFYESFRDRDELVVAIFDAVVAEVAEEIRAAASEPQDARALVRATIAAWVEVSARDPRKGRLAFVEALGSEALMRRRLDTTRRFAALVADTARASSGASRRDSRTLEVAGLVVAGALIETMIEWLEGGLERTAGDLVEDYTRLCMAAVEAAMPGAGSAGAQAGGPARP